jgi:hypothetical protein
VPSSFGASTARAALRDFIANSASSTMPAVCTSTSTRPNASRTRCRAAATSRSDVMSACSVRTSAPSLRKAASASKRSASAGSLRSAALSASGSALRESNTMRAPRFAATARAKVSAMPPKPPLNTNTGASGNCSGASLSTMRSTFAA